MAHAECIFLQTVAESLIGDIDQRQYTLVQKKDGKLFPLFPVQVCTGRIMAAAVQKNDIPGLCRGNGRFQCVERDAAGCGIEVGPASMARPLSSMIAT